MEANITIRKLSTNDLCITQRVALKAYCDHYLHLWYDGGDWYKEKALRHSGSKRLADDNALFFLMNHRREAGFFLKINVNAALNDFQQRSSGT